MELAKAGEISRAAGLAKATELANKATELANKVAELAKVAEPAKAAEPTKATVPTNKPELSATKRQKAYVMFD